MNVLSFGALLVATTLCLAAGCGETTSNSTAPKQSRKPAATASADLQEIVQHFSGESAATVVSAWPKVLNLCPGLVTYRGDYTLGGYQDNTYRDDIWQQGNYKFLEVSIKVADAPSNQALLEYGVQRQSCGFRISPDGHLVAVTGSSCLRLCFGAAHGPEPLTDLFIPLDREGLDIGARLALAPGVSYQGAVGYTFANDAYRTVSPAFFKQTAEKTEQTVRAPDFSSAMHSCLSALLTVGTGTYKKWTHRVGNACRKLSKSDEAKVLRAASDSMARDYLMFLSVEGIVDSARNGDQIGFTTGIANQYSEWGAMGGNLVMRTNETYVLNQHGDYVNSCAWGSIVLTENASELKGDAHREEQLTRGCKHLDPSQEADVNRTMETLLKRAKNL